MTISTYASVQAAVSDWLHRADLSNNTADFIALAESRIWQNLRIRQMETTMSTVMASGVIAVPSNYVEMKNAYISSTTPYGKLQRKSADWIYATYPDRTATDLPGFIAREGSNFIFGPYPDANYTVTMVYYNKLPALSGAVNTVFTTSPGLWLFGALCEAAPFLKNDVRVPLWEAKFKELLGNIQRESDTEDSSGGPLSMSPG